VIDMTADQIKGMPMLRRERGQWVADDRTTPPAANPPSSAPSAPPRQ